MKWWNKFPNTKHRNTNKTLHYFTKNFYNNEQIVIDGYNQTLDSFDGGEGQDIMVMTEGIVIKSITVTNE